MDILGSNNLFEISRKKNIMASKIHISLNAVIISRNLPYRNIYKGMTDFADSYTQWAIFGNNLKKKKLETTQTQKWEHG